MANPDYPTIRQDNLRLSELAVSYVKRKMTIGASNKISDLLTSLIAPEWSRTCVAGIRKNPYTGDTIFSKLRTIAHRASEAGCGNCGEQAAIAFIWLYDKKVGPLDYMSRTNADHAFVVVGRIGSSPLDDPSKWGDNCYVCDPWDEEAYHVRSIDRKMYGGGVIAPRSIARSN